MKLLKTLFIPLIVFVLILPCYALTDEEIGKIQVLIKDKPTGERMAFWAEKFVGVPYDADPLGEYVTRGIIVADERVDCMYLTFRVLELALGRTPDESIQIALEKRFHSKGILKEGKVINYDERFEYGEDMIESGKWGRDITHEVGLMTKIKGSRGKPKVEVLPTAELLNGMEKLKSGDIIFFVKNPEKRKVREIVGHIGILKVEKGQEIQGRGSIYLIHASGLKGKGGIVKKVLLKDYLSEMPFLGVKITRFQ